MLFERNNIETEFDSALRRHLKGSGAAPSACAGLDPDLASSYLEGAIAGEARAGFESHLAACRECRRQLVGLSRLSTELADRPIAPGRLTGLWERWGERLAGEASRLFRPGQWAWNRGYGATALAAAAMLLITATIAYRMQPNAVSQLNADKTVAVGPSISPVELSDQSSDPVAATEPAEPASSARLEAARTAPSIPRPDIRAAAASSSNRVDGAISAPAVAFTTSGALAPGSIQPRASEPVALPEPAAPPAQVVAAIPEPASELAALRIQTESETAPRILPSPSDNPMRSVSFGARGGGPRSRESATPSGRPGWADRVMGFMPQRRAEKAPARTSDEESVAPLSRKLQGKTFRFERGTWVDEDYRSDLMAWRVIRLLQGSPEIEKIIAAEPALREFFALGRIILVWKDRVYKVN